MSADSPMTDFVKMLQERAVAEDGSIIEVSRNEYIESLAYVRSAMVAVAIDVEMWEALDGVRVKLKDKLGEMTQEERERGLMIELSIMGQSMIYNGADPDAVLELLNTLSPHARKTEIADDKGIVI